MAVNRQIYELHLVDSSILQADAALTEVNRKLADEMEFRKAEAILSRAQAKLADVERRQREAEAEVTDIQARLQFLEKRSYDGSVTSPKELLNLEREIENLKNRLSQAEDGYLAIMDEHEKASRIASDKEAQRTAVKEKRKAEIKHLTQEKDKVEFDLLELREKRDGRVSALDSGPKALYESLRESLGGIAVATVGRGMCNSCRISLPTNVVQKARTGKEISQCPNCSRILCVD